MWGFKRTLRRRVRRRRPVSKKARAHYELHKETARTIVHERISYWQAFIPVTPGRVAIKNQSSRWGSCSTKGNLNFNYRLALIPIELADYVIVHELCHLLEFNHSPKFWSRVEDVMPDYALRKQALHEYTNILSVSTVTTVAPPLLTHHSDQVSVIA